jgi:hypothetical protein
VELKIDREVLRKASDWIRAREGTKQPFFAMVHLWGSHVPMDGRGQPELHHSRFGRSDTRADYDVRSGSSLEMVSQFVNNLSTDDIVVLMGDHGEEFEEHNGTTHGQTLYEEILAVPLLIRGTPFTGERRNCPLSCPDVVALAFGAVTGRSILPTFCTAPKASRYAAVGYPIAASGPKTTQQRALYLPDKKKVIWDLNLDAWELYDLEKDPHEQTNLAASHPELLPRAAEALLDTMASCAH